MCGIGVTVVGARIEVHVDGSDTQKLADKCTAQRENGDEQDQEDSQQSETRFPATYNIPPTVSGLCECLRGCRLR